MKELLFFTGFIFLSFQGNSQTTVERTANEVISVGNYIEWYDPHNGEVVDGIPIFTEVCSHEPSNDLILTEFEFDIPATAVIEGIELILVKSSSSVNEISDQTISLYLNNNTIGENKADTAFWSNTFTSINYGDTADLWNTTLSPADINDSGFGVLINTTPAEVYCQNAFIDFVKLSVTYTDTMGANVHSFVDDFSIFPNPAKDVLTLKSKFPIDSFSIYSVTGNEIFSSDAISKIHSLSIQNLANGVYFLKAESDGISVVRKFVKR